MDENTSKEIALAMLAAASSQDVLEIIQHGDYSYWLDDPQNWHPYGGREKNWDTVGNQQGNAVGALTELITNGIDAVLLKKAKQSGVQDPRSDSAPKSMFEAVRRFFPQAVEGKISNLEPQQRTDLAKQCMLIGVKRADRANGIYPTYTVVDFGEGQKPEDFPKTLLSLGEKNKEGIPFVQGKFNMGSTGSLRFCTRSDINLGHYKFVLSKRMETEWWGWTLIRVRRERKGEALPVAEFFSPGSIIPKFRQPIISAFGHAEHGQVGQGSIIKLYEYDIGSPARNVDFGLYNGLTVNLIDCALPILIYDFDAKPTQGKGKDRAEGIAPRTFGGMNTVLAEHTNKAKDMPGDASLALTPARGQVEFVHHVKEEKDEQIGTVKIIVTAVSKFHEFLEKQRARIFYTVNGQTQATQNASFLNERVGLGDLRNHILVNVVCDKMDSGMLATVFMPDRERKASNQYSKILEDIVIAALKEDSRLREYAATIRRRRATEHTEDEAETTDFLNELVKIDPSIKELLGLGVAIVDTGKVPGGHTNFEGKKFPTFLKPLNLRSENGVLVKEVPLNGHRRIECGTDAENEYLERNDSPGRTWCSIADKALPHSVKLWNGTATYTVKAPKSALVGDEVDAEFGFMDDGANFVPLKFKVQIKFVEEELADKGNSGSKTNTKEKETKALGFPKFEWVAEADWSDHEFDEEAGAYVSEGEPKVVYINRDNKYLRLMRIKVKDEADRIHQEHMFKWGLGLLTLSVHKKAIEKNLDEAEAAVRLASSAISGHIVTIIRRLGGSQEHK